MRTNKYTIPRLFRLKPIRTGTCSDECHQIPLSVVSYRTLSNRKYSLEHLMKARKKINKDFPLNVEINKHIMLTRFTNICRTDLFRFTIDKECNVMNKGVQNLHI